MDVSLRLKDTFNTLTNSKTTVALFLILLIFNISYSSSNNGFSFASTQSNLGQLTSLIDDQKIWLGLNKDVITINDLNNNLLKDEYPVCYCGYLGCAEDYCWGVDDCGNRSHMCYNDGCNGRGCSCAPLCDRHYFLPCDGSTECECGGYECPKPVNPPSCKYICKDYNCGTYNACGGNPCSSCTKPCLYSSVKDCAGTTACSCDNNCNCPQKCDENPSTLCNGSTKNCASYQGCNGLHCGEGGSYCDGTICSWYYGCPKSYCGNK